MQNFSPLASKLREETGVREGRRDRWMLPIQKFTVFIKNSSSLHSGIKKIVELAHGGYAFFNVQKMYV